MILSRNYRQLSSSSFRSSTLRSYGNWAFSIIFSVAIFLAPALWNGFAIVFFDTGGYVGRVFDMNLAPGRSLFYGIFLWASSLGWQTFWGPILVQSLSAVWVIHLMLRCHALPAGPLATAVYCTGMGLATGISWYTSQLMPDVLVPLATLSLWLLGVHWGRLGWGERTGLIGLSLLGLLSHMSCMALAIGLIAVLCGLQVYFCQRKKVFSISLLPPVSVVLASLLLMPALHLALVGKGGFTPGGPVFVFGRLVQDGIAQRWLAEHCPAPGIRLCVLQERMPHSADAFLWADDSPFQDIGGWSGAADAELGYLVKAGIKAYPGMFIRTSLQATMDQMFRVETGDGLDEFQAAVRGVFTVLLPRTADAFTNARQQQGQITQPLFDALNRVHVPVSYLSMVALVLILPWGARNGRYDFAGLAAFTLLALLGNAVICGALSNPHDRYQNRLIWIATLVMAMALGHHREKPHGNIR